MLVDSGSSTSFINNQLASLLEGLTPLPRTYKVRVADGGELLCSSMVPNCKWYSQGHAFATDMKVLALGIYDAILGMDWLEEHSPMTVDWKAKRIQMPTPQGVVHLCGHEATSTDCLLINSIQLQGLCNKNAITHMVQIFQVDFDESAPTPVPACVQGVITTFDDVFSEPTELPPRRACDHL